MRRSGRGEPGALHPRPGGIAGDRERRHADVSRAARRRPGRRLGLGAGWRLGWEPASLGDAAPARRRRFPRCTVRDPLGAIEAHGEAPPQLAADAHGGISVLYAVGKEVPGERFPRSALRFIRSVDSGRTWSEPRTVNDGTEFGSHNFHALTAAPDGYAAGHLARRAAGEVRRLDEPLHGWRPHLGAEPSDLRRSHLPLLPDCGRGCG